MPTKLKIASAQSRTLSTTAATIRALEETTKRAASDGVDIILFPEAYLGGYPRTCGFGSIIGARSDEGREQYLRYFHEAVDLGDTPQDAGDDWVDRKLPLPKHKKHRGDGTREELERIARETGVFIVTGLVERSGGTLYCAAVFVCPRYGIIGKRRKVMPTGSERLVWGQGKASTLRAVTTEIKGVRLCMGTAICWENYMPLLRQALYCQNVNLWFAPTADARDAWLGLMRTVGVEGRCFVVSANQCVTRKNLPDWITGQQKDGSVKEDVGHTSTKAEAMPTVSQPNGVPEKHVGKGRRRSTITLTADKHEICWPTTEKQQAAESFKHTGDSSAIEEESEAPSSTATMSKQQSNSSLSHAQSSSTSTEDEFVSRGGSSIVSPMGEVLAGPLWEVENGGLLVVEADFEDCERGRLDLDVAGSYSRMDSFHLTVDGLDLSPPP